MAPQNTNFTLFIYFVLSRLLKEISKKKRIKVHYVVIPPQWMNGKTVPVSQKVFVC